jgi:preprotein translocase SecE subunit
MARQTRQERRARRAQQEPALAGGPPQRPPAAPPRPTTQGDAEPRRQRGATGTGTGAQERHFPGSRLFHFIQEAIAELKKVEWPSQKAVISGTAVVLVACVIVGTYLWLNDQLWQYIVQHVLLR